MRTPTALESISKRALLVLALAGGAGCQTAENRTEPFDPTTSWLSRARQSEARIDVTGASDQARQIERNLGAR